MGGLFFLNGKSQFVCKFLYAFLCALWLNATICIECGEKISCCYVLFIKESTG